MDYLTSMPSLDHEFKYDHSPDLFSSKDEQKSHQHPGLETSLPAFDVFVQGADSFSAQAKTYRTPFDSPDPILTNDAPLDAVAAPTTASQPTANGIPPPAKHRSLSVDAYSPAAIFFSPTHNARTTTAAKQKRKKPAPVLIENGRGASSTKAAEHKPAATSSSTTTSNDLDPLAAAVIPDILSSRAFLERRASEPTLGARRAALAAAEREKAAKAKQGGMDSIDKANAAAAAVAPVDAATNPAIGARKHSTELHIDLEGKLTTQAASDVNRAGPWKDVSNGSITPKPGCSHSGCGFNVFANELCATHLTAVPEPTTPTTAIRKFQSLWKRTAKLTKHTLQLEWQFSKKGERYTVKLWEDLVTLERTVIVNGTVTFRAHVEEESWRLSMVLGKSKSSAFEVILGAWPHGSKGTPELISNWIPPESSAYDFELWLDGFPFTESQQNWLSELGAMKEVERVEVEESKKSASDGSSSKPHRTISFDSSQTALSEAHQQHYDALQYIKTKWTRSMKMTKTSMGYPKATVEWRFTLAGSAHTLRLVHSQKSGKRTILLDQQMVVKKKPGMLDGMLLKRSACEQLTIGAGVPLEVRIQKMHYTASTAAEIVRDDFVYELFIDGVAFGRNTKTLIELAGGMTDVEEKFKRAQAEKEKRLKREAALKKDPRTVDFSPEPEKV